jgi:hypothetical protein
MNTASERITIDLAKSMNTARERITFDFAKLVSTNDPPAHHTRFDGNDFVIASLHLEHAAMNSMEGCPLAAVTGNFFHFVCDNICTTGPTEFLKISVET